MPREHPYHHGDLRSALLAAGAELIAESGVSAVTLRALSERVGVSHAAPYRHFSDRRAIVSAIACEGFKRLDRELAAAVSTESLGATSAFEALAMAYVEFAVANPAHYRLMFGKEVLSGAATDELRIAARVAFKRSVSIIEECQEAGTMRAGDPMALANTAWATVHGLASLLINGLIENAGEGRAIHSLLAESSAEHGEELSDFSRSALAALLRGLAPDAVADAPPRSDLP